MIHSDLTAYSGTGIAATTQITMRIDICVRPCAWDCRWSIFHGIVQGKYLAIWPVFIVADNPQELAVTVAVDDAEHTFADVQPGEFEIAGEDIEDVRRRYSTSTVRVRLHQRSFRERVLDAYRRQCAFCRFRHEELLQAAHIIPDREERGEPIIKNGISLCSLHHAAFDNQLIGLRPDYVIEVRPDVLRETDGPTLVHGIQALHGKDILLPHAVSSRPDKDLLTVRYKQFQEAI